MSTEKSRKYQIKIGQDINVAWWSGARNVMPVLPTGGGKTWVFTHKIAEFDGYSCAVAHRQELVGQISLALNKRRVKHFAFVPDKTIRWLTALHIMEHGYSCYTANSKVAVAGVRTLNARGTDVADWCKRVGLWVIDEGHHVLRKNEWGKAVSLFRPDAYGLLPTATPDRADGRGLGRHADGVVDALVLGPTGRELMAMGYLTEYKIYGPETPLGLTDDDIGASGDYKQKILAKKTKESPIVGDVVKHYLKIAPGKLGITFVPSVDIAADIAASFRQAGVPAEAISANTPDQIRFEANRRLARGDLKQLVNVDIFGEGYDCPAIEVVSFARKTESYSLFSQQFGRGLRIMAGKQQAVFIDHVGNFLRHAKRFGTPDTRNNWTLDRRERRSQQEDTGLLFKVCPGCTGIYEAFYKVCPYCGYVRKPVARSAPEFVEGDLLEYSPELLASLQKEIDRVDANASLLRWPTDPRAARGAISQHQKRQEAQAVLRDRMALWGGWQRALGRPLDESWRRFYLKFGVCVMTAKALGRPDAENLTKRIEEDMKDVM